MSTVPIAPRLHDISPDTLKEWILRGDVVLVDVREEDERRRERIACSTSLPLSRFDARFVPFDSSKTTVLVCRSGRRKAYRSRSFATSTSENIALASSRNGSTSR